MGYFGGGWLGFLWFWLVVVLVGWVVFDCLVYELFYYFLVGFLGGFSVWWVFQGGKGVEVWG